MCEAAAAEPEGCKPCPPVSGAVFAASSRRDGKCCRPKQLLSRRLWPVGRLLGRRWGVAQDVSRFLFKSCLAGTFFVEGAVVRESLMVEVCLLALWQGNDFDFFSLFFLVLFLYASSLVEGRLQSASSYLSCFPGAKHKKREKVAAMAATFKPSPPSEVDLTQKGSRWRDAARKKKSGRSLPPTPLQPRIPV